MPLDQSTAGGERDQPRYIPIRGEVLRREIERLGYVQAPITPAALGSGTADDSTYLRGDGTWAHIEAVRFPVKNNSGGTLAIGTPVYATGSVGASGATEVSQARADTAANMPAIGLLEQELLNNGEGFAVALGVVRGLDTSTYSINQVVYVGSSGGLTGTRPTTASHLVQNIGRVIRVHASTGEILIMGPGRTNAVPNYTEARLIGRGASGGDGDAQEITVGSGLTLTGTTLTASGGGGGAPVDATYVTTSSNGTLTNEVVTTNSDDIVINTATANQIKWEFATQSITATPFEMLTGKLLGRSTISPATGAIEQIDIGKGLSLSGGELKAGGIETTELGGDITTAGKALLVGVDAAAQRTSLGLGTLATQSGTFSGTSSGTNTGDQTITLTGDVTGSGTGSFAATIAAGAVGTSKLGGDITTAGKALLDDADASAQRTTLGLGTLAVLSSVDEGDLVNEAVTYAKMQNVSAASKLIGRGSSGAGSPQEITLGSGLSMSGTTLSATGGSGSNEVKFANAGMTATAVNSTTLVDLASKTVTVTAGDTIEIELVGTILNNSGTTRTYTFEAELGAFGVTCIDGTTIAASATNRAPIKIRAVYSVASTSSAGVVVFAERAAPGAADTGLSIATTTYRHAWHTSASNLTGSQAIKLRCLSSAATATQTFTVHSFIVRQYPQAL
jgi:hypothetical protein